jgi:MFS family permease
LKTDLSLESVINPSLTTSVRWNRIAPTIFIFWIIGMIDKYTVGVIVTSKSFLVEMNMTGQFALIGLLSSVVVFSQAGGNFLFGWLTDRLGPKRCAIYGTIGWGLSTVLSAISPNLGVLLFSRLLLGLAEGYTWPVANSLTARWFPKAERGRAKALWISSTCVAPAMSGFVTSTLLDWLPWRGVFWVLGGISLVICLPLVMKFLEDTPEKDKRVSQMELNLIYAVHDNGVSNTTVQSNTVENKFKTLDFWMVTLAHTGTSVAVWALAAWFPSYLAVAKHFSPAVTRSYLILAYGIGFVVMIAIGFIIDRSSKRARWAAGAFAISAIAMFLATRVSSAIVSVLLLTVMVSLIYGVTLIICQNFMHVLSNKERIGRENGVMVGITNFMASAGPIIMGALISYAHGSYNYAFGFLVLIFSLSTIGCLVLMRKGY